MSEEIRPALSAEEWRERAFTTPPGDFAAIADDGEDEVLDAQKSFSSQERQKVAALALHGQPFGFTWAGVDVLRQVIAEAECNGNREWPGISQAESIVDCIAALLPPRGL